MTHVSAKPEGWRNAERESEREKERDRETEIEREREREREGERERERERKREREDSMLESQKSRDFAGSRESTKPFHLLMFDFVSLISRNAIFHSFQRTVLFEDETGLQIN